MCFRFLSSILLAMTLAAGAWAADPLAFDNAWVRITPPNAPVAGAYMEIVNTSKDSDRLLSASSDSAERVEIHNMASAGTLMQMRQLTAGLAIPAGQRVALAPGGAHLMLIAPKRAITEGQSIVITLVFEKAGTRRLQFTAAKQAPKAETPMPDHHHKH